jgi:hypothetical protein
MGWEVSIERLVKVYLFVNKLCNHHSIRTLLGNYIIIKLLQ